VCIAVCLCVGLTDKLCKNDRDAVWGLTYVGPRNHVLDGEPDRLQKGHLPAHDNVPTHECIAQCSLAAAGECACPAHAADECAGRHEK